MYFQSINAEVTYMLLPKAGQVWDHLNGARRIVRVVHIPTTKIVWCRLDSEDETEMSVRRWNEWSKTARLVSPETTK